MSYQALYRKYRPSKLGDVVGQTTVIKILKNAINNNKINHAYMFSGPRGIGKTTIAKILAKTVNCLDLKDGECCGKCKNCVSINDGFSPDIIEIDAASNNGVDEIREIKNKISLVPNQLRYKVYIIDEVHMLSIGAFNALLKTLEEPPEHIIFILATTDLHKVPPTIISRCQCFDFNRISVNDIIIRLEYICSNENIKVDKNVLKSIAELSDGGLRDAVGMLDKLNAYSNSNITIDDFEKVNGIVSLNKQEEFLNYINDNDIVNIIKFIDNIYDCGKDIIIFVQNLISLCKNKYISHYIDNKKEYDIEFLISFLNCMNELLKNIVYSSNIKMNFEISILSYLESRQSKKKVVEKVKIQKAEEKNLNMNDEIISREIISEEKPKSEEVKIVEDVLSKVDNQTRNYLIINNCFARASKQAKKIFENKWSILNDYALDSEYGAAACFISDGSICAVGSGEIIISFDYESMINRGFSLLDKIEKLFEKIYNSHYDVALITSQQWNEEKNKFIENKNNNIEYVYKPLTFDTSKKNNIEVKKNLSSNSLTSQAIELFGEDMISIN